MRFGTRLSPANLAALNLLAVCLAGAVRTGRNQVEKDGYQTQGDSLPLLFAYIRSRNEIEPNDRGQSAFKRQGDRDASSSLDVELEAGVHHRWRTEQQQRQLKTLEQFEDPINQVKEQQPQNLSPYQSIKYSGSSRNKTSEADPALQVRELNRDFLSLFDELWKIKNSSVIALVQLDYFTNQTSPNQEQQQQQKKKKQQQASELLVLLGNTTSQGDTVATNVTNEGTQIESNRDRNRAEQPAQQLPQSKSGGQRNGLVQAAAARLSGWLAMAQQRLQLLLDGLRDKLVKKTGLLVAAKRRFVAGQDRLLTGQQNQQQHQQQRQPIPANLTQRTDIFENADKPERLPTVDEPEPQPNNTRVLNRRSIVVEGPPVGTCKPLMPDEEAKCRSSEQLISATLNNSFPGTMKAIEENCKLTTWLFNNCWPEQLYQLRGSLSSWNESLLLHADFQLPAGFLNQQMIKSTSTGVPSCGLMPQYPQYLRDRVNWMWLNLCVDKKFRQDYVDNLRCLSTWNQEKAQQVCSHEYKRMQNYLASQAETGNALSAAGFEWARGTNDQRTRQAQGTDLSSSSSFAISTTTTISTSTSTSTSTTTTTTSPNTDKPSASSFLDEEMLSIGEPVVSGKSQPLALVGFNAGASGPKQALISESELTDREVSSKMLCCMFDQFLRCVHKQAVRDCGRPGAQFVVNFMSRIGTDDMKYLCNSETRGSSLTNRSSTSSSSGKTANRRGSSHEGRSPFIDGHYCTDPRIQSGLSSHQLDRTHAGASGSGISGGGGGSGLASSKSSSRHKSGDKMTISHDPTFFGSERVIHSACARLGHSPMLALVVMLSFFYNLNYRTTFSQT